MAISAVRKLSRCVRWRTGADSGKRKPSLAAVGALPLARQPLRHILQARGGGMGNLRAGLVAGFPERPVADRLWIAQRKRQVGVGDLAENVPGQRAPECRSGRDAAAVVAATRDHVIGEPMELRQPVRGQSDVAVPLVLELDAGELRKQPSQCSTAPVPMDEGAQVSEGADAPENQATLLIQSKGAENLL